MNIIMRLIRLPFELLATLQRIEVRLEAIQDQALKLNDCIDSKNHRNRKCLRTAHWND